ncbi:MAG: Rpn family recombination-promoting nuclease/putative transposase [Holosporales bacterium]|jgi:predicted transposase/invertase (TIGR01784 family)|nr:Rpn family recombination-promoting nuclease/putative transposase [Holosporales bacterium]
MTQLLDPKLDYIFKNVFGVEKNKAVLRSFLNALLKGKPYIEDLHLDNTDITKVLGENKGSRLDIKATSDDGTVLNIEIQCRNSGEIPQRAFHYLANMMPSTIKPGGSYRGANVISIWILGENVTNRQDAISDAYMTFQPNGADPYQVLTDCARIIFLELQKFNVKDADTHDLLTGWISFLKDPIVMDDVFLQVEEVKQAMSTLKYISADDEVRAIADILQKTINDYNSEMTVAIETGLAKGLEEGLAKGLAEGQAKGKAEGKAEGLRITAASMLKDGVPTAAISKYTGLSVSEIEALQTHS